MPGFQTQITTHNPPQPFGSRLYGSGRRPSITDEWISRATQSEHVLAYPPLATTSPSEPQHAKLTITKTIYIGNSRGAQLVVCSIDPQDGRNTFLATAKIFDPVYYPFQDRHVSAPIDVVWMADMDYSREAAAYEHLRTLGETDFTPQYFGSWTFDLPISYAGIIVKRPVRLVLIEYLDGSSIEGLHARNNSGYNDELNGFHYAEEYRLEILAHILDGTMKQMHTGLDQGSLAARDVMLIPRQSTPGQDHLPRVVLVDYNNSIVYEKTFLKKTTAKTWPSRANLWNGTGMIRCQNLAAGYRMNGTKFKDYFGSGLCASLAEIRCFSMRLPSSN